MELPLYSPSGEVENSEMCKKRVEVPRLERTLEDHISAKFPFAFCLPDLPSMLRTLIRYAAAGDFSVAFLPAESTSSGESGRPCDLQQSG
jgi:hypothetical protein